MTATSLTQVRSRLGEPESGMVTAFVVIFTLPVRAIAVGPTEMYTNAGAAP